jgi:hypothetical protein
MAKKSLKKRIDDLVDALGRAKKPSFAEIRSELVSLGALAQEMEDGQALSEKEAAIAALEAENENLKIELQTANAELKTFRAEWKKQEEEKKREDIPDIQLQILRGLPTEHMGDGATLKGICQRTKIPPDEAEVHLDRLEKSGFAKRRYFVIAGDSRIAAWHRTIPGNELILARRLAGEEEPTQQDAREHPELSQMETIVLLKVARREGMTAPEIVEQVNKSVPTIGKPMTSLPVVLLLLIKLREKNLATDGDEPDWGTGRRWVALPDGIELLDDRGLL